VLSKLEQLTTAVEKGLDEVLDLVQGISTVSGVTRSSAK
jgi:hypothetical protein